ncbi:engulfment and cell motility protein 3 isoform X4 [Pongo abelii]|uniref:engulfment and cell motility protein 3 isoform X4 n=1 Tax=Pongo abelii TaxID=9601 RepID=UPI003005BC9B
MARSRSRPRVRDTEVRSRKGRTSSSPGAPGQVRPWPQVHGLQKVQAPMPGWTMAPPRNVVKIAIQMRDAIPQLIQLDQAKPLAAVLKEVCDAWSLTHSERYALQFADGHRRYITENNRAEIKNGSILCLSTAPDLEAEQLLGGLQSDSREGRREALRRLVPLASDMTFAREVISRNGLQRLGTIIEDGDDLGEVLALSLRAFSELMEHGVVSWETLSIPFVRKVVCYVNMNLMDASVPPLALGLLESVTLSSPALGQLVKSEVPLDRLLVHLQVMNQQLQTKAMALLTALLQGASPVERKHMLDYLWQRNLRQFIYKNIIHSAAPMGDEMAHHLYVLQALMLGLLEPRMRTPLDPYSQEQREQLQVLRQAAFEVEGESSGAGLSADRRRSLCAREFRKLGFSNSNPAQDLERVPPGLLALDNMLYFSRNAPSAYSRFVLENSSREDKHECPFARGSIQLTVLLCELLRVGEPCSETAQDFSPMFFGQDQSFHELFCVGIQLLNKTWKEMRATQEDFDKISCGSAACPPTTSCCSTETWRRAPARLPWRVCPSNVRQAGAGARHLLSPDRLGPRGCQDCSAQPSLLPAVPVADMRALLTGKDCPHVREKGSGKQNKDLYELAFSISYDRGEEEAYLNFIAPSKREFYLWTDGLSALLGSPMGSEQTRLDLEQLLTMETKLRLLELENVPIPERPPPVPPPPTNFNFCYDCSIAEP